MESKAAALVRRSGTYLLVVLATGWTVVNARAALSLAQRPPTAAEAGIENPRAGLPEGRVLFAGARGAEVAAIHIFSDYECETCRKAFQQLEEIYASDEPWLVPVRVHQLPLSIHKSATPMAVMSVCAGRQGRFAEAHAALFRAASDSLGRRAEAVGKAAGVPDPNEFEACLQSAEAAAEVRMDAAAAGAFGDPVTPIWVIGDSVYFGLPYDLKRLIKTASVRQ